MDLVTVLWQDPTHMVTQGGDAGPGLGNELETPRPLVLRFRRIREENQQAEFCQNRLVHERRGRGLNGEQEPEEAGGAGGGLPAPQPAGGRADGVPCGAGWEARKFPPDVSLPVEWEAGSCREGRGKQRRRGGFGVEGERRGCQAPAPSLWPHSARE